LHVINFFLIACFVISSPEVNFRTAVVHWATENGFIPILHLLRARGWRWPVANNIVGTKPASVMTPWLMVKSSTALASLVPYNVSRLLYRLSPPRP
jgi:hypothetical protein